MIEGRIQGLLSYSLSFLSFLFVVFPFFFPFPLAEMVRVCYGSSRGTEGLLLLP